MDILHIERKGPPLNTWELSAQKLQMNDTYTDIHNPILDPVIKHIPHNSKPLTNSSSPRHLKMEKSLTLPALILLTLPNEFYSPFRTTQIHISRSTKLHFNKKLGNNAINKTQQRTTNNEAKSEPTTETRRHRAVASYKVYSHNINIYIYTHHSPYPTPP
jgi:hypothetical protein